MTEPPIRIAVVEDHPTFRRGLRAAFDGTEIEVVVEAGDAASALDVITDADVDVAVVDIGLPDMSGIDLTRRLALRAPGVRVCILTMHEDDESVFQALRAGAIGYVVKGSDVDTIERAVRAAAHGEAHLSAAIARRMQAFYAGTETLRVEAFPTLTRREREVLERISRGEDNRTIAARLVVSEKTVRNAVSSILGKLHVSDRTQAAVRARDAGLGG